MWPQTKAQRSKTKPRRRGREVPMAVAREAVMEAEVEENNKATI